MMRYRQAPGPMMALFLLLLGLCALPGSLPAQRYVLEGDSLYDLDKGGYMGYRLELDHLEVLRAKRKSLKLAYHLYNTGRHALSLPTADSAIVVIVKLPEAFMRGKDAAYAPYIVEALAKKRMALAPGEGSDGRLTAKLPDNFKDEAAGVAFTDPSRLDKQPLFFNPNFCPDLAFDTVRIIKEKEKYIIIEYQISNRGKASASLYGGGLPHYQAVAIRPSFAGTPGYQRGMIELEGTFIEGGLRATKGVLLSGMSYTGTIKIPMKKASRSTRYLVLLLDCFGEVQECDETNNTYSLLLK